jgi:hypothetical protein
VISHTVTTAIGDPSDPRNGLRALLFAAAKVGLPHIGLRTLPHSAVSVMHTRCVPLKVASEIPGLSSIATTGDIYGQVFLTSLARPCRRSGKP